jgi:hypothetical protein
MLKFTRENLESLGKQEYDKHNIKVDCGEIGCSQVGRILMIRVKVLVAAFVFDMFGFHVLIPEG